MLAVFTLPRTALTKEEKADEKLRTEALQKNVAAQWKFKADVGGAKAKAKDELNERLSALAKTMEDENAAKRLKFGEFSEGENGISYLRGPRCSFACHEESQVESVSAYFRGDLTQKNINEIHIDRHLHDEDDCHKIIHMYHSASTVHNNFATEDFCQSKLMANEVAAIHGPFIFILYDRHHKRIVVGRDAEGKEPLFWAANAAGDKLFFSTDKAALFENAERAAEFPKGGLYISKMGSFAGSLNVKLIDSPRDILKTKRELAEQARMERIMAARAKKEQQPHSVFYSMPQESKKAQRASMDAPSSPAAVSPKGPGRRGSLDSPTTSSPVKASPFDLGGIKRSMRALSTT